MRIVRFLLPLLALAFAGCQTAGYYMQAVRGQLDLLGKRRPIAEVIQDPGTPPELKRKLERVLEIRRFAASELHLPLDGSYLTYADLGRRFAVWNIHAAPALSLEPRKWCYPLVGRLSYRGFFSREAAFEYGTKLHERGDDVHLSGVETYSTLGWFNDPILNTFIHRSDAQMAEILFHELAHQKLFIRGDTDFNEAFATAVAAEGTRRWLAAHGDTNALMRFEIAVKREAEFAELIAQTRKELEAVYTSSPALHSRNNIDRSIEQLKLERKREIIDNLHARYGRLRSSWNGYSAYDAWFSHPINNAQLNSVATYYDLVPGFEALLRVEHGDLAAFYTAVQRLQHLSKDERRRYLGQALSESPIHDLAAPR